MKLLYITSEGTIPKKLIICSQLPWRIYPLWDVVMYVDGVLSHQDVLEEDEIADLQSKYHMAYTNIPIRKLLCL